MSSKSENKHIILDTSEQQLNWSYCHTQDSDTEDNSNTNGSASEQSVFSASDSENSDIAIAWPEKKKKRMVEESSRLLERRWRRIDVFYVLRI